ncbi:MAG: hypothetical protein LBN96_04865 [Desulfovibrio sp.]|jgi:hypothetical protein|nr:hypothetical protein [Desulfovibrio sp.]
MTDVVEFNHITYSLPVEKFRISANIALDERLPAVTEFCLKLIYICDNISIASLRKYFGFTPNEVISVVESLHRQGFLDLNGETISLTKYALERFQDTGGKYPRLNKIERHQYTVVFELFTFIFLPPCSLLNKIDTSILLEIPENNISNSKKYAEDAFHRQYPEIASTRADKIREKSFSVYSIEDIESVGGGYINIPVSFALNSDGNIIRNFSESIDNLSQDFKNMLNKEITSKMPNDSRRIVIFDKNNIGLNKFIAEFGIHYLGKYINNNSFNIIKYLINEKHFVNTQKTINGVESFFGNIYLDNNIKKTINKINEICINNKLNYEVDWVKPDYALWGKDHLFIDAIHEFRDNGKVKKINLWLDTEYNIKHEQIFHNKFNRNMVSKNSLMAVNSGERIEIMLFANKFMIALYHLSLPSNEGVWIPFGILSTLPKHIELANKMISSLKSYAPKQTSKCRCRPPRRKRN